MMLIPKANDVIPWGMWISDLCSRSFQVICGHMHFFAYASYINDKERCRWSHRIQLVNQWICTLTFSHHFTIKSHDLRLPEVETCPWPFAVNKCMFWCISRREARWRSNHCSNILSPNVDKKPHGCLRPLTSPQKPTVDLRSLASLA